MYASETFKCTTAIVIPNTSVVTVIQIAYTNRRMRGSIEAAVICHFLDSTKMECIWMLRAKGSPPWQVVSK
jgi:hypothetical protein